jgi:mono/diheme cytochrome c family protein
MTTLIRHVLCLAAMASLAGAACAQATPDFGRMEYESSCASCHGRDGKGDGPVRPFLTKAPSDLTTLAKRSGGALPLQYVWETIDGRASKATGPHGSREMPVWGERYGEPALSKSPEAAGRAEWYIRGRIMALIDYLNRIQVKQ